MSNSNVDPSSENPTKPDKQAEKSDAMDVEK